MTDTGPFFSLPTEEEAIELIRLCMEQARTNPTPQNVDAVNRAIKTLQLLRETETPGAPAEDNSALITRIEQELLGL